MEAGLKIRQLFKRLFCRAVYNVGFYLDPRAGVMIGLTYFCQCRCSHCAMANYPKKKQAELSTEELTKLITKLPKNKIRMVYFFGGEPLLRDDIFELINCAHKKGFRTKIDTNGILLNQAVVKKLKNTGLDVVGISIDSPNPQIHNSLRGKENLFERATEGIKNCLKEGIKCYLSTYVTRENLKNGDFKKLILLGENLGVSFIRVLFLLSLGRCSDKKDDRLNHREQLLLEKICRSSSLFIELESKNCYVMKKKVIYISPYGEVQPCYYMPFVFGNVRKEPLENIIKRMWTHSIFKVGKNGRTKECPIINEEFQRRYLSQISPVKPLLDLTNDSDL